MFGQRTWGSCCPGPSVWEPGKHPLSPGKLFGSNQVSPSGKYLQINLGENPPSLILMWLIFNLWLQRLSIAKEFGDKAAERRAYSNLGNALIFLGQFTSATEYYRWGRWGGHLVDKNALTLFCIRTISWTYFYPFRKTLQLSRQLRDQVMEAQACYSLGNTYTLLQQYERAIDYHLKHLYIAQELNDR